MAGPLIVTLSSPLRVLGAPSPIDLGVPLGGATSQASAINNHGQIVGFSGTAAGPNHAALWTPPATAGAGYTATDLGTLPGATRSEALAINSGGEIVGSSDGRAVLWSPPASPGGRFAATSLATLGGGSSTATGINDAGLIVGYGQTPGAITIHAMVWTPVGAAGPQPQYAPTDLGTLVGPFGDATSGSLALGINNAGQIVGTAETATGNGHPAVWTRSVAAARYVATDLGTLGGNGGEALGINSDGQIAGFAYTPGNASADAVRWVPSATAANGYSMADLGTFGGDAQATTISDSGVIVGDVYPLGGTLFHAALWMPPNAAGLTNIPTDLGAPGDIESKATGINRAGQIVGYSGNDAMLWSLPTTVPEPVGFSGYASAVYLDGVTLPGGLSGQGTAAGLVAGAEVSGGLGVCEAGPAHGTSVAARGAGLCGPVPARVSAPPGSASPLVTASVAQETVQSQGVPSSGVVTSISTVPSIALLPNTSLPAGLGLPASADVLRATLLSSRSSASCTGGRPGASPGSSTIASLVIAGQLVETRPTGSRIIVNPTGRTAITVYGSPILVNPTGARIPMAIVTLNYSRRDLASNSLTTSPVEVEFPARGPLSSVITGRVFLSLSRAAIDRCSG